MPIHPELEAEQAYLDHAYDCLDDMRGRTSSAESYAERERKGGSVDAGYAAARLRERMVSLDVGQVALCFGRITSDHQHGDDDHYIGRRHVENGRGEPVVIDWRAPAAVPFYRATLVDAQGLALRRRFVLDDRKLVDLYDEDFRNPDSVVAGLAGGIPDPLLAELERSRTGEMRDIVATIQAEQDRVVRAPLERCLVVQGGPGTGKTAVGLHRAAYLLYEHRERLEREGVLVIGPNPTFLRYIAQVLPSLGESSVTQTTFDGLRSATYVVRGSEPVAAATIKGDARMAQVIDRACRLRLRAPSERLVVWTRYGRVVAELEQIRGAFEASVEELDGRAYGACRDAFRQRVVRLLWERWRDTRPEVVLTSEELATELRNDRKANAQLDKSWPAVSGPAIVRQLLSSKAALAKAARGVLDAAEQALLIRAPGASLATEPWTVADIPLLDESDARTTGVRQRFGHIVVDEAQDLSAMALRMLGRRGSSARSFTILGDLAQATTSWAQSSWDDVLVHLSSGAAGEVVELEVGYRVPAPILELANRVLPHAAAQVRPSRSVRAHGEAPRVIHSDALSEETLRVADELRGRYGSVAIIAPEQLAAEIDAFTPLGAKGLEFDAVVLVEPAAIWSADTGARQLYVALTRAVHHLTIVHASPLPAPLS